MNAGIKGIEAHYALQDGLMLTTATHAHYPSESLPCVIRRAVTALGDTQAAMIPVITIPGDRLLPITQTAPVATEGDQHEVLKRRHGHGEGIVCKPCEMTHNSNSKRASTASAGAGDPSQTEHGQQPQDGVEGVPHHPDEVSL